MPSSTISSKLALHGKVARIWGHPGSNTEEPPWSGHFRHEGIWKEISCFAFSELRKRRNFCLHPWEQHWTAIPCLTLESWQHPWDSEVVSLSGQCSQHWPSVAGSPDVHTTAAEAGWEAWCALYYKGRLNRDAEWQRRSP